MRSHHALLVAIASLALTGGCADAQWPEVSEFDQPVVSSASAIDTTPAQIAWEGQTANAFTLARRSGRPILVYITAEKCGFCRKMERETWSDPEVARLVAEGFVPLKLRPDTHPDEVATLRVRAYPTTVLVSPEGKPLAGRVGFVEPAKLVEMLRPEVAANPAPASR